MKATIRRLAALTIIAALIIPAVTSAQSASPATNVTLIAELTQLVQLLEQELQQLIATHGRANPTQSILPQTPNSINQTSNAALPTAPVVSAPPLLSPISFTTTPTSGSSGPTAETTGCTTSYYYTSNTALIGVDPCALYQPTVSTTKTTTSTTGSTSCISTFAGSTGSVFQNAQSVYPNAGTCTASSPASQCIFYICQNGQWLTVHPE